ncbi:MAG: patatin-like phospholipase family protein [Gemmatimonadota bacterium]
MSRIALVLGGGVSLGTYVAGAVIELLTALERNRRGPCTVEVIAGASAGALVGALAARALAINPNLLPWIEKAWVEGVDAERLLNPAREDRSGLLDVSVLDELSSALITAEPASDDRRSAAAGSPIGVGIALSNLLGVRYRFRYGFLNAPDRYFGTRVYRDAVELEVAPEAGARDPVWERMRQAAVASASFPFAFPPRPLVRARTEFPGAYLPELAVPSGGRDREITMWYADGGLFQNEPLGLAKRLVERRPDHRSEAWSYILVDPYMEMEPEDREAPFHPPRTPAQAAACLARAVLGQSAARDWIRANKTNARLEILAELVKRLPDWGDRLCDPEAVALGRAIGELAERVAEMKVAVRQGGSAAGGGDPALTYLDENLRRVRSDPRFAPVLARVETRAARTRLAKLIFILEAAGGLRDKEVMPLYLVSPPSAGSLSGDFMANFGGFFSREWRANDFRAGRRDARALLESRLSHLVEYRPDPPAAYQVEELEGSFERMPAAARRRLDTYLHREADRLVAEFDAGFPASLLAWAWKPIVRRWAKDRILEGLRRAG